MVKFTPLLIFLGTARQISKGFFLQLVGRKVGLLVQTFGRGTRIFGPTFLKFWPGNAKLAPEFLFWPARIGNSAGE